MSKEKEKVKITITVTPRTLARLDAAAKIHRRSRSAHADYLLEKSVGSAVKQAV